MELNGRVFGRIRACEVLGAEPELGAFLHMLGEELAVLTGGLEGRPAAELGRIRAAQADAVRMIGARSGAMALHQSKIRAFTEFSGRYAAAIDCRIRAQV